jgi:hypothetical protein
MHAHLPILLMALSFAGCSEETVEPPFDDVDVTGRSVNPDGLPYPTDDLGGRARDGDTPGARIPNFSFQGYPDGDLSRGLQVISLADYYDPSQKRNKVLHLMAAVAWCPHCQALTQAMVAAEPTVRQQGAVIVQTLLEGPEPGVAPSLGDLNSWVNEHAPNLTVVFDAEGRRLSTVATLSGVPWNAMIDTRSMELLEVVTGSPVDYAAWVGKQVTWVENNPARP